MSERGQLSLRRSAGARLPLPPAVLSLLTLIILGWLTYQSAGALLLWRSHDKVTASLESAVEDLSTLHSTLQECVYSSIAFKHTRSYLYSQRYVQQRALLSGALERSERDLADASPQEEQELDSIAQDIRPLLQTMDVMVNRPAQEGLAPDAGATIPDGYDANETIGVRMPRDNVIDRLERLQFEVRNSFYARRADATKTLRHALVVLFWSAVGALALACLILTLLAWVARQHAHAERGLMLSEEQYRDLLERSSEMVAVIHADGEYLYTNPAWQARLGRRPLRETVLPEEADRAAMFERRALDGLALEDVPLRLTVNGRTLLVLASLSCRGDDAGVRAVRWICRDVTEREAHERRLRAQVAVGQALGSVYSPADALPLVLEQLGVMLEAEAADIWMTESDQQRLRRSISWTRRPDPAWQLREGEEVHLGDGLPGCVLRYQTGCWQSVSKSGGAIFRSAEEAGPEQVIAWGVPIAFQGEILATMQFYAGRPVPRDPELLATVEAVGVALGQFLARCNRELQLETLHRQTDSILGSVTDGIFGVDSSGRALFVNPAAAALLGQTEAALRDRDVHALLHGNAPAENACTPSCMLRRVMLSREGGNEQDVVYRRDGSSFMVEYSVSPLTTDGAIVGSVLTLRDVTERHALDRLKDEFVSTVSHELRTPLTSIRGALGLLSAGRVGEMNEEAGKLLRIAVSNTDRLIRLINDILDLERMESGRSPLQIRSLDLAELLQQSLETMRPLADAANIRIHFTAESAMTEVDPDRMLQVFTNLLSNAIKFSPQGSTITAQVEAGENQVAVCISDEGRGIPVEKLESIFDRFQQVDATDSRQKGGTGLGLAICRTILQQHGGRVWAERNPERGVSFRMLLPRTQSHTSVPAELFNTDDLLPGDTVLVCDDDRVTRELVKNYLQQHSYQVLEASTGEDAIMMARMQRPQVVLLDMNLPGISGWEVLNTLKSDPLTAGIPVVVLSMFGPAMGFNAESSGWLQKPVDDLSLIGELGRVLRGRPGSSTTVLLVEDDADLAHVIETSFQKSGIRTYHASTLQEARRLCDRVRPDLMVLDLGLPDGDGMELVEWLRQHYELHRLPLVVYSGRDVTPAEQGKLYQGPTQILGKAHVQPAEIERLVLAMLRSPAAAAAGPLTAPWDAAASNF